MLNCTGVFPFRKEHILTAKAFGNFTFNLKRSIQIEREHHTEPQTTLK